MPTFLVNPKMRPELARRVSGSVSGRKGPGERSRRVPGLIALARVVGIGLVALLAGSVLVTWEGRRTEREVKRAALLSVLHREAVTLSAEHLALATRARQWLLAQPQEYPGDSADAEFMAAGGLGKLPRRDIVYVRGAVESFRTADGLETAVAESQKDALLLCLLDPPAEATEKALLPKVYLANGVGRGVEAASPRARRLAEAHVAASVFGPALGQRVRSAPTTLELEKLQHEFDRVPLDRVKAAARAELLVFVMDEPKEAGAVTELDGANPHSVRVGIIDAVSGKLVFLRRRRVDPAWISEKRRPDYARGLNGCKLALELRTPAAPSD